MPNIDVGPKGDVPKVLGRKVLHFISLKDGCSVGLPSEQDLWGLSGAGGSGQE